MYLARPLIGTEELVRVKTVFDSGFLTEGRVAGLLERKVAKYVATRFGIASTSCTTAIHSTLLALKVSGGEVVVPDFTYPATIDAIVLAGGKPVLVDVDLESRNVTGEVIEEAIGPETRCILPVSLFGNPLEMAAYKAAGSKDIPIVEDAACSLGARIGSKSVGCLADATCFSFHPRKIITMGEGGMITTDREDIARACRSFKAFGSDGKRFLQVGTNLKLPDILAAIGLEQMKRLERIIRIRAQKARIYEELLGEARHVRTPIQRKGTRHTFQTYTVYFERPRIRDRVIRALARRNIESRIASYAIHQQPAFKRLRRAGDLANSRLLYERALALPLHHRVTDEDQQLVCKIVTRIGKS